MDFRKATALNSTREADLNYGHALLTQRGGWTLAEFSKPFKEGGHDFARTDFEDTPDKVSRPEKTPERAS